MATTRKYLNHLLQNTGITPACSEEERAAAEDIARIFTSHGFTPEVQEFNASGTPKTIAAVLGIVVFVGAVLMGVGGIVGVIGLLLVVAAGALYVLERMGKISFAGLGASGLSQNVIAYHKASGPLASPRNRPVVVVAHYDSPRGDLFAQMPYATYKPLIVKLLPYLMVVPAILAIIRLLPFPGAAKVVLWLLAIVAAVVPLANAVGIIANRFVLPYTSGSVCNKSSVAAMLGVMDAVAPFGRGEEFPNDVPFEDYFSEQVRRAQAAEVEAAVAAGDLPVEALNETVEGQPSSEESAAGAGEPATTPEDAANATQEEPPASLDVTLAGTATLSRDDLVAGQAAVDAAVETAVPAGATAAMPVIDQPVGEDENEIPADDLTGATVSMPPLDGDEDSIPMDEGVVEQGSDEGVLSDEESEPEELVEEPSDDEVEDATDEKIDADGSVEEPIEEGASESVDEPAPARSVVNALGNYRYGADVIRSIGMLPTTCDIEYDLSEPERASEPVADGAEPEVVLEAAVDPEPEPAIADDEQLSPMEDALVEDDSYDEGDQYADQYADDESFDYGDYDDEYEDELTAYVPTTHPAGAASSFAETLSSARAKAVSFFDGALRKGKSMLDSMTAHEDAGHEDDESEVEETTAPESEEAASEPASTDASAVPEDAAESDMAAPDAADAVEDSPAVEGEASGDLAPGATQRFDVSTAPAVRDDSFDSEATVAATMSFAAQATPEAASASSSLPTGEAEEVETVDSLMAQITAPRRTAPRPAPQKRAFSMVPDPAAPSVNQMSTVNRSSLFDLPDPSTTPADPFLTESTPSSSTSDVAQSQQGSFSVVSTDTDYAQGYDQAHDDAPANEGVFETISVDAPEPVAPAGRGKGKRGLGKLFHRKRQEESSMSDWLGVDDDFDAKSSGRDIGSWDNFEGDDWKGGATGAPGTPVDDLRDAVTSMGDDELLGHDIWFVATGASELDNAGIQAFLDTHRDKLRGVFLINLESIGAGDPCMLATEGGEGGKRVLKGDKRIMNLVRRVSGGFHREFPSIEMPYITTDAYRAMSMSLRSLTIAGVEGNHLACSHTVDDLPYRISEKNVRLVADVVTEVIRRS